MDAIVSEAAAHHPPLRSSANDAIFAVNRATGRVALAVEAGSRGSRAARIHESGSLRVRFPHREGRALEAVTVNTAGGMTGGDRFDLHIRLGAGAMLSMTTVAAEKIYRSTGSATEIAVEIDVGPDADLVWLPQETILFDRSRLRRTIDVRLARGARLLLAEATVFGRSAMGETVVSGTFLDRWRVRLDGALIFAETVHLDGDIAASLAKPAVTAGRAAVASLIQVPGDEQSIAAVRALEHISGEIGISAWNGVAVARLVAPDGAALRRDLAAVVAALSSEPLPRLWLN